MDNELEVTYKNVFEDIDIDKISKELKAIENEVYENSLMLNKKVKIIIEIRKMLRIHLVNYFFDEIVKHKKYINLKNRFYLDIDLLNVTIQAYYEDIYRFKLYSQSEHANTEKRCGYFIKWFTKIKPIQIEKNKENSNDLDENQRDIMVRINSEVAIILGGIFVWREQKINILRFFKEDNDFYNEIVYATTFRNISSKHLSSMMHILFTSTSEIQKETTKMIEQLKTEKQ